MRDQLVSLLKSLAKVTLSVLGIAAIFAVWILVLSEHDSASKTVTPKEARCRTDIECWGKEGLRLTRKCVEPIERAMNYDFKWTDGTLEPKMSRYRWHNEAALTITYSGDSLLQQNDNGAFVRMIYECDFDPIGEQVIAVRVHQGRLGFTQQGP